MYLETQIQSLASRRSTRLRRILSLEADVSYAMQNSAEYFAECFREYTLDPTTLKRTCPRTYEAIKNALGKITDQQVIMARQWYGSIWKK
ncbi:MAG: anthrax toxin lethal factor-related metalloendopeptidase [Streptococcus sp.]